jgi:hypothetical protein
MGFEKVSVGSTGYSHIGGGGVSGRQQFQPKLSEKHNSQKA